MAEITRISDDAARLVCECGTKHLITRDDNAASGFSVDSSISDNLKKVLEAQKGTPPDGETKAEPKPAATRRSIFDRSK